MIKLRNFWVALAMGCAVSLGTTSCDEDEEENQDTKKEQSNDKKDPASDDKKDPANNNNGGDKTPAADSTQYTTPEASGETMKEIVNNFTDKGSNLIDQATSMTTEELKNLAATIIEYDKNKDNKEWKESFENKVGSSETATEAVKMLDDVISKLVGEDVGVDMSEMTPDILVEAFSKIVTPKDKLGKGYEEGFKEGESHKATIAEVYDESFASIPTDLSGLDPMMKVFQSLTDAQKKEFINVALTWANKEGDDEWKKGFLAGTGLSEKDQKVLGEKLDFIAQYKTILAGMA